MRREAHHHLPAGGAPRTPGRARPCAGDGRRHRRGSPPTLRRTASLPSPPARPGHAGLGVDHDLVRLDRLGLQQRHQRKLRAGRVAAGIGDEPRLLDLVAVNLDQAIDRLLLQLRRMMLVAVPARIGRGVVQPEIGAERSTTLVFGALARRSLMTFCVVACGSAQNTRSSAAAFQSTLFDRDQRRQLERRELRKHRAHLLPGPAVGGEQRDLDTRMAQQQPHQFRAGIAGGAENADFRFGGGFSSHVSILIPQSIRTTGSGHHRGASQGEKPRGPLRRPGRISVARRVLGTAAATR